MIKWRAFFVRIQQDCKFCNNSKNLKIKRFIGHNTHTLGNKIKKTIKNIQLFLKKLLTNKKTYATMKSQRGSKQEIREKEKG